MAGESNYGGNGSVYWKTQHTENGQPVNLKKRGNAGCQDQAGPADHTVDIGNPHFVKGRDPQGNSSSLFTVTMRFDTSPTGSGSASQIAAVATVGSAGAVARSSLTRVAKIEAELENLVQSAQNALNQIKGGATEATVEVNVPVIERPAPPQNPNDGWEVTVRWN